MTGPSSVSPVIADGLEVTIKPRWTVRSLSEEFRIQAQGQKPVTSLWGFGLKVHVELEPNLAPLLARTTRKPGDLVRPGTHEQAGNCFAESGENGMDTVREAETKK